MPLFSEKIRAIIECLLYVSGDPLSVKTIAEVTGLSAIEVNEVISELKEELGKETRGLQLLEVADGYQLTTKPEFAPYLEKLFKPQAYSISLAALETLSIIAYEQPVTRAEIEQIRGVKVDSLLGNLLEKGLIEELGRREGPGRPILYGVTSKFLSHFGLKDIGQLPNPDNDTF